MRERDLLSEKTRSLLYQADSLVRNLVRYNRKRTLTKRRALRAAKRANARALLPENQIAINVIGVENPSDLILFSSTGIIIYHESRATRDPQYWKMLRRLKPGQREQFRALWRRNEEQNYFDKRMAQFDEQCVSRQTPLVIAHSPKEFCSKIFRRCVLTRKLHSNRGGELQKSSQKMQEMLAIARDFG